VLAALLGLDWGSVPTWVGTIVTGASALLAAFSYRRSVRDKEREQASKVAAWIEVSYKGLERERRLRVANRSEGSIFALFVEPPEAPELRLAELPAGKMAVAVLPAGTPGNVKKQDVEVNLALIKFSGGTREEAVAVTWPVVEFMDALGRNWRREPTGTLRQIAQRRVVGVEITVTNPLLEWVKNLGISLDDLERHGKSRAKKSET
jgi:hypothetical protein